MCDRPVLVLIPNRTDVLDICYNRLCEAIHYIV